MLFDAVGLTPPICPNRVIGRYDVLPFRKGRVGHCCDQAESFFGQREGLPLPGGTRYQRPWNPKPGGARSIRGPEDRAIL